MASATVSIQFSNQSDKIMDLQIEPWASWYRLKQDDELTIIAESDTHSPTFEVEERGDSTVLTIVDSKEYYIVKDGKRHHMSEYRSNVDGW